MKGAILAVMPTTQHLVSKHALTVERHHFRNHIFAAKWRQEWALYLFFLIPDRLTTYGWCHLIVAVENMRLEMTSYPQRDAVRNSAAAVLASVSTASASAAQHMRSRGFRYLIIIRSTAACVVFLQYFQIQLVLLCHESSSNLSCTSAFWANVTPLLGSCVFLSSSFHYFWEKKYTPVRTQWPVYIYTSSTANPLYQL